MAIQINEQYVNEIVEKEQLNDYNVVVDYGWGYKSINFATGFSVIYFNGTPIRGIQKNSKIWDIQNDSNLPREFSNVAKRVYEKISSLENRIWSHEDLRRESLAPSPLGGRSAKALKSMYSLLNSLD